MDSKDTIAKVQQAQGKVWNSKGDDTQQSMVRKVAVEAINKEKGSGVGTSIHVAKEMQVSYIFNF